MPPEWYSGTERAGEPPPIHETCGNQASEPVSAIGLGSPVQRSEEDIGAIKAQYRWAVEQVEKDLRARLENEPCGPSPES